ncbi:MAG: hypothetical protein KDC92_09425 [Bacteroidetes bacterium]|nr:hypothetical protein [Bacteroidota bacterium]
MEKEHYVVLISVGDAAWSKQTVLSFLSLQCRLNEEIPKYKTLIITDKPRVFKGYFGTWVEIIALDKQQVQQRYNDLKAMKYQVLFDLASEKQSAHFLYVDSDMYFKQSGLSMLNKISENTSILGKQNDNVDFSILGFSSQNKDVLKQWRDGKADTENVHFFQDYFHYSNEKEERLLQINAFFDRHYYREMGELFTLVKLWTPDLWHLPESELPQELL